MFMYRTERYSSKVEKVEVIKETAKCVWAKHGWFGRTETRKELKVTSCTRWFHTFDEAKAWKLGRLESSISSLRGQLVKTESAFKELKATEEPK